MPDKNTEEFTNVEIANGYIDQGWEMIPPLGCQVLFHPRRGRISTFTVSKIEIEIDQTITVILAMIEDPTATFMIIPKEILKFVFVPDDAPDARLWWRRPRDEER